MTWVNHIDTTHIALHTSQGRDVLYTRTAVNGCIETYTPQAGDHVMSMQNDTCKQVTTVQLLTGESLLYNSFGQISQIQDTMPTPNTVTILWTGTSAANVSTVTDASGTRRLLFGYNTNNLLTSVQFQLNMSGFWTPEQTVAFDYTNGITRDATSQWFVPQSMTEWTNLLAGSGIPNPTNQWNCQEASGNLADSIGTATLTAHNNGGMAYQQAVSGWSRKAVTLADNTLSFWQSSTSICNPATTKCTTLGLVLPTVLPTSYRDIFSMGDANGARALILNAGTITHVLAMQAGWDGNFSAQIIANGTPVRPWVLSADPTSSFVQLMSDNRTITPAWATGTSTNGLFTMGDLANGSGQCSFLYMTEWNGTSLSTAQMTTLINRIKNGAGLSSVTIGGQLAQKYVYDGSGFLAQIQDGGGSQVAAFAYSSTTPGQVDLISTSRGTVGFEYNSTRTACSGKTALYFNLGNALSCNVDTDCGTGFMCGGKTGSGATGKCFLAGRCLTLTNAGVLNGEQVVASVAPLGPGGGTCSGACTDVMAYSWTAVGTGNINVIGRADPLTPSNFTSATYNSNGLPTQIGYGDTDADPTNGGTNRTEYIFYDSLYPGRIAEIRRASDNPPPFTSCSATPSDTSGCARTLYCYGQSCAAGCSADNELCTITQTGFTLDATAAVVPYSNTTMYVRDAQGRVTEIDGPVTGIKSVFAYNPPTAGVFEAGMLGSIATYTDSLRSPLTTAVAAHDLFGHPTAVQDPNGKFTCDSYDPARGVLTSRTRAMAGQTDCSHPNSADITTSFVRDSALRLTQLTRPDGSCVFYTYDSLGRPNQIKRRDDCNSNSSGDTQQYAYTPDSQVSELDTYDASNTLVAKQPYTYFASRRLQSIVNPVNTTQFTGMVYDAAGKVTEIDGAGALAKTVNHYDSAPGRDGRITSVDKYKTSTTFDTWSLLYAWLGDQSQVTDGDTKVTGSTRDDLGRLVKISSPDLGAPTVHVFDAASRLVTTVEDLGGPSQVTHSFTYDALSRQLVADYQLRCPTGMTHPQTQRTYDVVPTSSPCPAGMSAQCTNVKGHLAFVQQVLLCSPTYTDGSLDQFTWFAYDDAGRLIEEYITDDTGRNADHRYTYTKNGALASVTTPAGMVLAWNYGSLANNSDTDLVSSITMNQQNVIDSAQWFPFGPWKQYDWEATIGGTGLRNRVARNLAYRISTVYGAELQTGASNNAQVAITEDAMGRVTSRAFSPAVSGLQNSFFTYDEQSRVTCESAASGTCPTSGSNLKNNQSLSPPFLSAGDWKQILRPIAGSNNGTVNNFNTSGTTYGTSHQITDINQSNGAPKFQHTAFTYNAFGDRTSDDNTSSLTNDRRDYVYDMGTNGVGGTTKDERHNVTNIRGQYFTGGVWHSYDVTSSFDAKNRRVYKSFYDETTAKTATWFFYYDVTDRLTEVRYTPDSSALGTYSVFDLVWLRDKLALYWETDYPSATTSKRYVASDETDRPMQLWNWPSSGDATRVWAINPSAWGFDTNIVGASVYQPILFAGQYRDVEAAAFENDGVTVHRPGIVVNGFRSYDPFTGSYLQVDPNVDQTWSSYAYVNGNPVGAIDPKGLDKDLGNGGHWEPCSSSDSGTMIVDGVETEVVGVCANWVNCKPGEPGCPGVGPNTGPSWPCWWTGTCIGSHVGGGGGGGGPGVATEGEYQAALSNPADCWVWTKTECYECCTEHWDDDWDECRSIKNKTKRGLCWEVAAALYGTCSAGCEKNPGIDPLSTITAASSASPSQ